MQFTKKQLCWGVITIFVVLLIGHLTSVMYYMGDLPKSPSFGKQLVLDLFFFEHEKNLPAWFSAGLFLLAACYFSQIAKKKKRIRDRFAKQWKGLQYVCIFLACDEWFSIHENLNDFGLAAFDIPYWVIIYLILTLLLVISYVPFIKHLPKKTIFIFIAAAGSYIGGAALFETVNYQLHDFNSWVYQRYLLVEDGLEICGCIILLYGCASYIEDHLNEKYLYIPTLTSSIIIGATAIEMVITYLTFL